MGDTWAHGARWTCIACRVSIGNRPTGRPHVRKTGHSCVYLGNGDAWVSCCVSGGCFDEPISCCVGSHLRLEMYVSLLAYMEKYKVFEKRKDLIRLQALGHIYLYELCGVSSDTS